jgi:zinc protease
MSRPNRLAVALLSSVCFLGAAPALAQVSPPSWPQAHSDLAPDPAVRFGVLANGMRYAIMRNATPAGQTSLRLRVGSGSLQESDAEQGLAHVLEHMAFRGSTHVPAGDMIKILQRKGLAFGPDTNAETEWTQTVYMLDLPHSDQDSLDTGLMLMRETAGNLLIDPKALATERGVVLSEERLRDTPDYRAEKAQIDHFLHGQLAARRFPIGQVDVVKTAPASLVRQFYEANYRPDRTTLIAVGDFDPDVMEARIKAQFSDWKPMGPPTAEPDLGRVEQRGTTVKIVEQPGAATRAVIAWARPYDASPDTAAKERRETVENLGLAILNRRLGRLAQGEHPPFLSAGAGFQNLFQSAKIAVVEATSPPDQWKDSLSAAEREVRRLTAYGVSQEELDREITDMRAGLQNAVAGAATRPTPALAAGLVDTVNDDEVFTPPSGDLAVFDSAVKGLRAETVDAAIRGVFAGSGPLVELATPKTLAGGEAEVGQAFAQAASAPLTAGTALAAVTWPYTSFGSPGAVVGRAEIADLGVTTVRFANGARLMVKPTALRKDQVLVSVNVGDGRLALPTDHPTAEWAAPALVAGGFGKITFEDSQRALAGKVYGVAFSAGNDAFQFKGAARPADLATELQVITAYITDPGFRPEAFERTRASLLAELPQLDATPDGVLARDGGALFTRDDPRFAFPSHSALLTAKPDDLKALLTGPLSRGPIDVTIVGDIDVDRAIALTAATLGALPPRPPAEPVAAAARLVRFPGPTATPVLRLDTGRADQAVAAVAWPAPDFFADMKRSRAIMLAGDVLENRLVDKVRIAQGATYSPETRVDLSQVFPGYGFTLNEVEMPPPLIPGFFDTVTATARDMIENGVSADELDRARNPRLAGLRKAQLTNEYWLADLTGALADPRRLELIRSTFPDYEGISLADIQAAARDWFKDDRAWRLVVRAGDQASLAAPVSAVSSSDGGVQAAPAAH